MKLRKAEVGMTGRADRQSSAGAEATAVLCGSNNWSNEACAESVLRLLELACDPDDPLPSRARLGGMACCLRASSKEVDDAVFWQLQFEVRLTDVEHVQTDLGEVVRVATTTRELEGFWTRAKASGWGKLVVGAGLLGWKLILGSAEIPADRQRRTP